MPRDEQWQAMWKGLGCAPAGDDLFHELVACYSEAHRRYHTLQHLNECLSWLPRIETLASHPHEIALALWFHDAVYDVKRQDNEEKSAMWARSAAQNAGLADAIADRVYELVMVTRHNAIPKDTDAGILVDIDLSILGAGAERFDEYESQVLAEYAWVPDFLFRRNRRKILEEFMARPRIFNTDCFFNALEGQARSNLARSIQKLGG